MISEALHYPTVFSPFPPYIYVKYRQETLKEIVTMLCVGVTFEILTNHKKVLPADRSAGVLFPARAGNFACFMTFNLALGHIKSCTGLAHGVPCQRFLVVFLSLEAN
jgi:hypothetical protein